MTNDLDEERLGYHGPKDRDRERAREHTARRIASHVSPVHAPFLARLEPSEIGTLQLETYSVAKAEIDVLDDEPAKSLAIALVVKELKRIRDNQSNYLVPPEATKAVIKNLLIGLGCEAVVKAWEECT